jgi:hypothetical protein
MELDRRLMLLPLLRLQCHLHQACRRRLACPLEGHLFSLEDRLHLVLSLGNLPFLPSLAVCPDFLQGTYILAYPQSCVELTSFVIHSPPPPGFPMPPGFPPLGMIPPGGPPFPAPSPMGPPFPPPFLPPHVSPPFPPPIMAGSPPLPSASSLNPHPNSTSLNQPPLSTFSMPSQPPAAPLPTPVQGQLVLPNPALRQILPDLKKKMALKYDDANFSPVSPRPQPFSAD